MIAMPQIGIMQGRLVPPIDGRIQAFPRARWREEFAAAAELGFEAIEFIFGGDDAWIAAHPLLQDGCRDIRECVARSGVAVRTVCADYFMAHPFHRDAQEAAASLHLLERLVDHARQLGVRDVVIPCVDDAGLRTPDEQQRLVDALRPALTACERAQVRLAFETDLAPEAFRALLERFGHPAVRVNYDIGNSASLGYDPAQEWAAYGPWVSALHVKDRVRGGSTVPLGAGSAQFDRVFRLARQAGYQGLFVIQGARGPDDAATARQYKAFVARLLEQHYGCVPHGSGVG
ncbi:MAG: sugar phosphate isomerase/epimerase [Candidatus Omnitrophica bacterium]|nr:sugar phosphate isomerase/epimerase [Candidatus Omnitrophota bacterium]